MEGMTPRGGVGFDVCGIRVMVTRVPGAGHAAPSYAAELRCDGELARGRLVRHGNACCLEVAAAPEWLHRHGALTAAGQARGVTDGDTVWLEVPPLVRAELVLPWLEGHRRDLLAGARTA